MVFKTSLKRIFSNEKCINILLLVAILSQPIVLAQTKEAAGGPWTRSKSKVVSLTVPSDEVVIAPASPPLEQNALITQPNPFLTGETLRRRTFAKVIVVNNRNAAAFGSIDGFGVSASSTTGRAGIFRSQEGIGVDAGSRHRAGGQFTSVHGSGIVATSDDGHAAEFSTNGGLATLYAVNKGTTGTAAYFVTEDESNEGPTLQLHHLAQGAALAVYSLSNGSAAHFEVNRDSPGAAVKVIGSNNAPALEVLGRVAPAAQFSGEVIVDGQGSFNGPVVIRGALDVSGSLTVNGQSITGQPPRREAPRKLTPYMPKSSFTIDHPLDPENKTLSHAVVESPDMMNIYNGNVTLDEKGEARITLPEWFEALNGNDESGNYRYQLTPIGQPGPTLYVAEEVRKNSFKIAGGSPNMKVSWQITGVRQDTYARENRVVVEKYKSDVELVMNSEIDRH